MPKFATKNDLFGYFWCRTLKESLSYMNSAPSNLSQIKVLEKNKTKMARFETKNILFGFFGIEFLKSIVIF